MADISFNLKTLDGKSISKIFDIRVIYDDAGAATATDIVSNGSGVFVIDDALLNANNTVTFGFKLSDDTGVDVVESSFNWERVGGDPDGNSDFVYSYYTNIPIASNDSTKLQLLENGSLKTEIDVLIPLHKVKVQNQDKSDLSISNVGGSFVYLQRYDSRNESVTYGDVLAYDSSNYYHYITKKIIETDSNGETPYFFFGLYNNIPNEKQEPIIYVSDVNNLTLTYDFSTSSFPNNSPNPSTVLFDEQIDLLSINGTSSLSPSGVYHRILSNTKTIELTSTELVDGKFNDGIISFYLNTIEVKVLEPQTQTKLSNGITQYNLTDTQITLEFSEDGVVYNKSHILTIEEDAIIPARKGYISFLKNAFLQPVNIPVPNPQSKLQVKIPEVCNNFTTSFKTYNNDLFTELIIDSKNEVYFKETTKVILDFSTYFTNFGINITTINEILAFYNNANYFIFWNYKPAFIIRPQGGSPQEFTTLEFFIDTVFTDTGTLNPTTVNQKLIEIGNNAIIPGYESCDILQSNSINSIRATYLVSNDGVLEQAVAEVVNFPLSAFSEFRDVYVIQVDPFLCKTTTDEILEIQLVKDLKDNKCLTFNFSNNYILPFKTKFPQMFSTLSKLYENDIFGNVEKFIKEIDKAQEMWDIIQVEGLREQERCLNSDKTEKELDVEFKKDCYEDREWCIENEKVDLSKVKYRFEDVDDDKQTDNYDPKDYS